MKIKGEFTMREVAGEYLMVPVGSTSMEFNGMVVLTETGVMVWKAISEGAGAEKAVADILEEYDVKENTVREDVNAVIEKLRKAGIIVD